MTRQSVMRDLAALLDRLDANGRYALLKLATGALRIGISARLAKLGFAQAFAVPIDEVEEYWHGLEPPFAPLFDWAAHGGEPPRHDDMPVFRPFMLAQPLEQAEVDLAEFAAEWKWDGIRVQLVHAGGESRLYSRSGDDISRSFPDAAALPFPAVLDGELLVRGSHQGGDAGRRGKLQRAAAAARAQDRFAGDAQGLSRLHPALRCAADRRRGPARPALDRAPAPARSLRRAARSRSLRSQPGDPGDELRRARRSCATGARDEAIEGLMLKRRDSPYVAGRKTGLWYKWKRDPLLVDCVLMYAQRGSGKRSSFYSDYTFGCWNGDPDDIENGGAELLPVGKAYFGFTDEELKWLDRYVRNHTVAKFGPVRETDKSLVFEVAFDSVHASRRHKSGLAMRFPRIARIRADKPAHEADRIDTLRALIRD